MTIMNRRRRRFRRFFDSPARSAGMVWCCVAVIFAMVPEARAQDDAAIERGRYIFAAAGCHGCHTREKPKGAFLAGNRRLETPFGDFLTPNITSDPDHGIGSWSLDDFKRAMRQGKGPDGTVYFPAFPYASYTAMSDADMTDLWAYLKTVPKVAEPSAAHELTFPFSLRTLIWPWRWLYFEEGRGAHDPEQSEEWNRGAYLSNALGHCGECHTQRNVLGGLDRGRPFAGNARGPEGKGVPNITPHPKKGIGGWSESEIIDVLADGFLPDGDFVGGAMTEVVENSTSKLTKNDLRAIAVYLKSLPPDDTR
jgi:mono/diheme cytochrome c family protein